MFIPKRPCPPCPWVKTTPSGEFTEERYEQLRATSPDENGCGPEFNAPAFACHKSPEGEEYTCAGWLASVGHKHPNVRFAIVMGQIDESALVPQAGWPELFTDYETMKNAQQRPRQSDGGQGDQEDP